MVGCRLCWLKAVGAAKEHHTNENAGPQHCRSQRRNDGLLVIANIALPNAKRDNRQDNDHIKRLEAKPHGVHITLRRRNSERIYIQSRATPINHRRRVFLARSCGTALIFPANIGLTGEGLCFNSTQIIIIRHSTHQLCCVSDTANAQTSGKRVIKNRDASQGRVRGDCANADRITRAQG